jgi:hypothetical protein
MLDNLFDMVKGLAGDSVINNPAVPNQDNDAVVAEATNTVAGGLQNLVAGGGLQSILSLFGGGQQQGQSSLMSNPIVSMMIGHFAKKLMGKFGLQSNQASGVAQSLIPSVISNLISKTNDPGNSSFTLDGLLHSITGGQSQQVVQEQQQQDGGFNFQNLIGQFTGGGQQGGGGLMDIVSKLAGGAQQAQQNQGGGGLMDMIKGFIK